VSGRVGVGPGCPLAGSDCDGLCVDPKLVGDVGQRQSGHIELGCVVEGVVVPGGLFALARHIVSVEVGGDGGAMDSEVGGQLADGGAGSVVGDEVVDVAGGETSLGGV